LPEIPFYDPAQEGYEFNLTEAEELFRLAWNRQLWTNGFNFTICERSDPSPIFAPLNRACEMLKASVESINPKFHIQIATLSSWELGLSMEQHQSPLFTVTWQPDVVDPDNYAAPFMYSKTDMALFQNYFNATVDELVLKGRSTANKTERRDSYRELQKLYHEDCPSVPLYQPRSRRFERDWVQGWYYNPLIYGTGDIFYFQWKEQRPPITLVPGENLVNDTQSTNTIVLINTTVSGNLTISNCDIGGVGTTPEGYGVHSIKSVVIDTTVPHENITFPIEVRIYYTDQEVVSAYVDQSTLRMFYWNGTDWILENDTGVVIPSDTRPEYYSGYVWARIQHLSAFAIMGEQTFTHAVAPRDVRPAKTVIGQSYSSTVYLDVFNQGDYEESLNMEIYVNSTAISTFTNVTLLTSNSATLTISWNTSEFAKGNYALTCVVDPVPGETAVLDNNYTSTTIVHVGVPGDVSGSTQGVYDGTTNMRDVSYLIIRFNTKPSSANWNANARARKPITVQ